MRSCPLLLLALALGLGLGCSRVPGPDVVLITLDTTRADRLGCMGHAEAKTPALDALAARGVLFERAYTSVPLTLPSHTTILTGLDPDRHGVHDNGRFVAPASLETVAERLRARGYATGAVVAAAVLDSRYGLDQGFDVYDDDVGVGEDPLSRVVPSRRGAEVTDRALAWVAQRGREPFFLWVHYYDVHAPRRPPPPFDAMKDPYDGELAYVDAQVGRLLEGLSRDGRGRQLLVVVVGDHGEGLGEHDERSHGAVAYDATLHVPLIAAGPGLPSGVRSDAFARTVDVAPTLLAAVGEAAPQGSGGVALQQLVSAAEGERVGYFETFMTAYSAGWARLAGVRTSRWKYTAEPAPAELYDVIEDPQETHNRVDDEPQVVARLASAYEGLRVPPEAAAAAPLAPEAEAQLAALGYVSAPQHFEPGQEPDPRRFVGALSLMDAAIGIAHTGRLGDAIGLLELLTLPPFSRALALTNVAPLYRIVGRNGDAVRAYHELVELSPSETTKLALADALTADGRAEEALAIVDPLAAQESAPSPQLHLVRARLLAQLGRRDEALAEIGRALGPKPEDGVLAAASRLRASLEGPAAEIEPLRAAIAAADHPERMVQSTVALAELLLHAGRGREAVALLEARTPAPPEYLALRARIAADAKDLEKAISLWSAVVAARPWSLGTRRDLADAYASLRRTDEAVAQYDRLIEAQPADAGLHVDRGVVLLQAGRVSQAEADFREATQLDDTLPEAFLNLGLIELQAGRDAEAEEHLKRAIALRPDYPKAHFHLARLYRRRGDPRAAAEARLAAMGGALPGPPPEPTPPVAEAPHP